MSVGNSKTFERFLAAKERARKADLELKKQEDKLQSEILGLVMLLLEELHRQPWMLFRVGSFKYRLGEFKGRYVELMMSDLRYSSGEAVPTEYFHGRPDFVGMTKDFLTERLDLPDGLRLSMGIDLRYLFDDGGNQ